MRLKILKNLRPPELRLLSKWKAARKALDRLQAFLAVISRMYRWLGRVACGADSTLSLKVYQLNFFKASLRSRVTTWDDPQISSR